MCDRVMFVRLNGRNRLSYPTCRLIRCQQPLTDLANLGNALMGSKFVHML